MSEHHLPWVYRPRHFDDWGWVRDFAGNIAATARGDDGSKSHDQHRSDKTDPYGEYAAFIVKAVNNHDALVKALQEALLQLEYVQEKHGYATGETIIIRTKAVLGLVGGHDQ